MNHTPDSHHLFTLSDGECSPKRTLKALKPLRSRYRLEHRCRWTICATTLTAFFTLSTALTPSASAGGPETPPPTSHRQIPPNHGFYFGVQVGYSRANYATDSLIPPYRASSVDTTGRAERILIGYHFNRILGLVLNVAYFDKPQFYGIDQSQPDKPFKIKNNIVSLLMRINLPINPQLGVYALGGYGYIVRDGIFYNKKTYLTEKNIFRPVYGAGIYWDFTPRWSLFGTWLQAPARTADNFPTSNFAGLGIIYRLYNSYTRD